MFPDGIPVVPGEYGKENLPGLPDELYDFQPYHYGPFDSRVYDDAKKLYEEGLVLRTQSWQGRWVDTMITPAGSERADELRAALPKRTARQIDEIVQLVQSLSFRDLLGYIYKKYPKYRENSVFQF